MGMEFSETDGNCMPLAFISVPIEQRRFYLQCQLFTRALTSYRLSSQIPFYGLVVELALIRGC